MNLDFKGTRHYKYLEPIIYLSFVNFHNILFVFKAAKYRNEYENHIMKFQENFNLSRPKQPSRMVTSNPRKYKTSNKCTH